MRLSQIDNECQRFKFTLTNDKPVFGERFLYFQIKAIDKIFVCLFTDEGDNYCTIINKPIAINISYIIFGCCFILQLIDVTSHFCQLLN